MVWWWQCSGGGGDAVHKHDAQQKNIKNILKKC